MLQMTLVYVSLLPFRTLVDRLVGHADRDITSGRLRFPPNSFYIFQDEAIVF